MRKGFVVVCLWLVAVTTVPVMSVRAAACGAQYEGYGKVTGSFDIPNAGTYTVWSRIYSKSTGSNSFLLDIDSTMCGTVIGGSSQLPINSWVWVDYKNGDTASKVTATLTAGSHSYTLYGRSDNLAIDRILFTSNCTPKSNGDGSDCVGSASSTSSSTPTATNNASPTSQQQSTSSPDTSSATSGSRSSATAQSSNPIVRASQTIAQKITDAPVTLTERSRRPYAIGGLILMLAIVAGVVLLVRLKMKAKAQTSHDQANTPAPAVTPPSEGPGSVIHPTNITPGSTP